MFPIVVAVKFTKILTKDYVPFKVGDTWYATYMGNQPDEADKIRKMKKIAKSLCAKHDKEIIIYQDGDNVYGVSVTCPNRRFKVTPRAIM